MEFNQDRAIFLQIADKIQEQILKGHLPVNERLLSVRELAVQLEVNPNTIVKSYAFLEDNQLIYKQRGKGFFVASDAKIRLLKQKKQQFEMESLPQLFQQMQQLDISMDEVVENYQKFRQKDDL